LYNPRLQPGGIWEAWYNTPLALKGRGKKGKGDYRFFNVLVWNCKYKQRKLKEIYW